MAVYLGSNEVNLRGGQPMENGLPSGGLTGQVLAKSSNDDYVAAWTTVYDVPAGGSVGQVLAKSSDDDYALTWTSIESDPALPSGGLNGQVLAKSSNDDYAVAWSTLPPGEFVITVKQTSTSGSGSFSMDRTIAQIKAAIQSGQHVVIYFKFTAYSQFSEPGDCKRFPYKQTSYGYYEFENDFIDVNSGYTELYSYLFKISTSNGAISLTRESAYGVAAGSSKYVGKFLGAVEGWAVPMVPEWQTIYQVPAEGSNGQFLKKTGSGSADYGWYTVYQVPTNGTTGQVLTKTSSGYGWADPSGGGLPSGGTTGQVLKKKSNTDYDAEWGDESGGGDAASILQVSVYEDDGTWKVDSSGTTFSDIDEPFFYFDHPFDIYLIDAPLEGYATTVHNIYRLTSMWLTPSDETYGHLLFSAVINDSGTIKLKTYQVDAVIQTGWSDATVTVTSTNV